MGFTSDQIHVLTDRQATRQGILSAINDQLINGLRQGDKVVFYYSGHGAQIPDTTGDEEDNLDEALIAYDATVDHSNWVIDDEINDLFKLINNEGGEVLAVIDSCHSGTILRGRMDGAKTPGGLFDAPTTQGNTSPSRKHQQEGGFVDKIDNNLTAFFAVAPNQVAFEEKDDEPSRPHGVFTEAFIKGIRGAADNNNDRQVSYSELFFFTSEQSSIWCVNHFDKCKLGLTPSKVIADMRLLLDSAGFVRHHKNNSSTLISTVNQPSAQVPLNNDDTSLSKPRLLTHTNNANLDIQITPSKRVQVGQTLRYSVRTEHEGRLIIIDINPQGEMTQLYPNRYTLKDKHNLSWIPPNRTITIPGDDMPFTIVASDPIGQGKIVAILIEDASIKTNNLFEISSTKDLVVIDDPNSWMAKLQMLLTGVFPENNGRNRSVNWSVKETEYDIIR